MKKSLSLALNAARNATCILREIPDGAHFAHHLADIDMAADVAVRIAQIEERLPELWNDVNWEEACAAIAQELAGRRRSLTSAELAAALGLKHLPRGLN